MGASKILILISFLIDPKLFIVPLNDTLNVLFAKNIKVEIFYWSSNLIARHKTLHFNTPIYEPCINENFYAVAKYKSWAGAV